LKNGERAIALCGTFSILSRQTADWFRPFIFSKGALLFCYGRNRLQKPQENVKFGIPLEVSYR
jgi:hypothetical protein